MHWYLVEPTDDAKLLNLYLSSTSSEDWVEWLSCFADVMLETVLLLITRDGREMLGFPSVYELLCCHHLLHGIFSLLGIMGIYEPFLGDNRRFDTLGRCLRVRVVVRS